MRLLPALLTSLSLTACVIGTDENLWKRPRDAKAASEFSASDGSLDVLTDGSQRADSSDANSAPEFLVPCSVGRFECLAGPAARYCKTGTWQQVGLCPLGCDVDSKSCRVPSNIPSSLASSGSGDLNVTTGNVEINTDTGAIAGVRPALIGLHATSGIYYAQRGQGTDIELGVFAVKKLTIAAGATLRGVGSRALVLVATGEISINGIIDVSASGEQAGPGGLAGGSPSSSAPGSCGGGNGAGDDYDHCCSSGGGGGGNGGNGGLGGHSICGSPHNYQGGNSGPVSGSTSLIPLAGGCGGAGGSATPLEPTTSPGPGGGGGGAVQLSSSISISFGAGGGINSGGGGGGQTVSGGGAAGGAGGSILLEAPIINVPAGATLAANGGGGGAGDCTTSTSDVGQGGQAGQLSDVAAVGGKTASSRAGSGGNGSAGNILNGSLGLSSSNGGGGGGGAGRIRINSNGTPTLAGTISPQCPSPASSTGPLLTVPL